ncbi:MAG: gamma-glutamyl-gamma-aminobutyrate hydrolase family protein [Candidatus Eremiobacteraeota bacterium]|nr:gamma-glutamyl-gamma-aminobutyrate hydrolase family protein [Candidatus Eremiobacteraeota bacterium]
MQPRIAITADAERIGDSAYLRAYKRAVEQAGGKPVLLYDVVEPEDVAGALAGFDGLLLPGGADVDPAEYGGRDHPTVSKAPPAYDRLELEAARIALRQDIPTFAICRGVQVMNVALGGTLYVDVPEEYEPRNGLRLQHRQTPPHARHEATHPVDLDDGSLLARVLESRMTPTNSMHHQALRRIAHDLVPTARTRDGIVEAVEARDAHPFYLGVQWHPEEMIDVDGPSRTLFEAFISSAARRAQRKHVRTLDTPTTR